MGQAIVRIIDSNKNRDLETVQPTNESQRQALIKVLQQNESLIIDPADVAVTKASLVLITSEDLAELNISGVNTLDEASSVVVPFKGTFLISAVSVGTTYQVTSLSSDPQSIRVDIFGEVE